MSRSGHGGLEASDINDKQILSATKQLQRADGALKFKIILDDGHAVETDWFNEDKKQEMIQTWLYSVKDVAVARAGARIEETKAKMRREQAERNAQQEAANAAAMGIIVPSGITPMPAVAALPAAPSSQTYGPAATVSHAGMDPMTMAQAQLAQAMADVQAAARRVQQWQAVVAALQATELPAQPGVIQLAKSLREE